MNNEIQYTKSIDAGHIKSFGQYFTKYEVADFMCSWACNGANNVLDPAVGNSVFLKYARAHNEDCDLTGYEIDEKILEYFGNPTGANLIKTDYLLNDWEKKYDAIVCNPPYSRFQAVSNRSEIIESILEHTGTKYSRYTNLYILFLIKSIYQLSDSGKLAYIIPSEFMNSKYGTAIKQLLIDRKLLRAIINFENDSEMFFNATTTCCILLLDHETKNCVTFYNLKSVSELKPDIINDTRYPAIHVDYANLSASDKWRSYINQEEVAEYQNLEPISRFCSISRGIATGANDFFCFTHEKAVEKNIPESCLTKCICRSADIKTPIFTEANFEALSKAGKAVYLLDASDTDFDLLKDYIHDGELNGINHKHLPSCRNPWYSMEQKPIAPIWVSSACRESIKFVRNIAGTKSLTTFHSVFIHDSYLEYTNIIFCYFLTPIAQAIIRENRKELGNGLAKFQPGDLNTAKMLDIRLISDEDKQRITEIYDKMVKKYDASYIPQLNDIFTVYM